MACVSFSVDAASRGWLALEAIVALAVRRVPVLVADDWRALRPCGRATTAASTPTTRLDAKVDSRVDELLAERWKAAGVEPRRWR